MTDDELINECFKWLGSDLNEGALAAEYCDRLIALARIGAAVQPRPIMPDDKAILVRLNNQPLNKEVDDEFIVLTKWTNGNWHSSAGNPYMVGEDFNNLVWSLPQPKKDETI